MCHVVYGIYVSMEVNGEMLPEYSELIYLMEEKGQSHQDGFLKGIELGLQEGILIFILDNLEEGTPAERIVQKLQKRFSLSQEEALE